MSIPPNNPHPRESGKPHRIFHPRVSTDSGFETTAQACLDLSSRALEIEENIISADLIAGT